MKTMKQIMTALLLLVGIRGFEQTAGPYQTICQNTTTTMAATGSGTWVASSSNPSPTTISNPSSPTTTISGFNASGLYAFLWGTGDTAYVYVNASSLAPTLSQLGTCLGSDSLGLSGTIDGFQLDWYLNGTLVDTTDMPVSTIAGGNGSGSAANQLYQPFAIFRDNSGNLYVADAGNNRVQKFPAGSTSATNGVTVAGGNGAGSAANQLNGPDGVYVDASGDVYVADAVNNRIQKFPSGSTSATNGVTVAGGNGAGSAANQLNGPVGICMDGSGNLYISDADNNRIQKFPSGSTSATNGVTVAGGNGQGSAADQFHFSMGICLDGSGNLYVADWYNYRIQKFPSGSTSATNGLTVAGGNGQGAAADQFSAPFGVFTDGSGNIYVADETNYRIEKFPSGSTSATNGVTVAGGNGGGTTAIQFVDPSGVSVDGSGNIYVCDRYNHRIQKWSPGPYYTPNAPGNYTATYVSIVNGCASAVSDTVTVTSCSSPAGPAQTICITGTVNMAASGTGTWTALASNPTTTTIFSPSSPTSFIYGFNLAGTYRYVWTSGGQPDTTEVIVIPSPNAGPDQTLTCTQLPGGTVAMGATGTGTWSASASNPGVSTITTPVSPTTTITGFSAAGNYLYIWTNAYGCSDSANVTVTGAGAGPEQYICNTDTAVFASALGIGTWSAIAGNPSATSFWNASSDSTHIYGCNTNGYYNFQWTAAGGCHDTLRVLVSACDSAGPNQTICLGDTDIPVSATGTGTWSVLPGNPATTNFITVYLANTHIEFGGGGIPATVPGVYRYLWTTSSGADTLTVTIVNCGNSAGPDQTVCQGSTITMAATGSGTWSALAGNPASTVIANPSSATTTISGFTVAGTYGYSWGSAIGDTMYVRVNAPPSAPTGVTASPSSICVGQTSQLSAISAGNAINWWTAATGGTLVGTSASGGNFAVNPSATTTYYAEAQGIGGTFVDTISASGTWTVPANVSSMNVYLWGGGGGGGSTSQTGTQVAFANGGGGGGAACSVNTGIAVTPGQVWTATIGAGGAGGTITAVNGVAGGTTTFVSGANIFSASGGNGGTGDATGSGTHAGGAGGTTGTGIVYAGGSGSAGIDGTSPTTGITGTGGGAGGSANAGISPASVCGVTGSGGTGSYYGGNGAYNTACGTTNNMNGPTGGVPGGGGAGDNNWNAQENGGAGGNGWVIVVYSLNACASSTRVPVTVTVSNCNSVGPDQTVCAGDTAFITAATGSGTWSVVAGNPSYSQFFNPLLPVTHIELSGAISGIYKYIWTTSSGPDTLTVTVNNCDSAGPDQTICLGDTAISTSATGTGIWSVLSGNPASTHILDPSWANTNIEFGSYGTPATVPGVYRYLWTTSSGADTLTVTINNCNSSAGPDQVHCMNGLAFTPDTVQMAATGIGTWSILSGNPHLNTIIDSPSSPTTLIYAYPFEPGRYGFVWTTSYGPDTVYVTLDSIDLVFGVTTSQPTVCSGLSDSFTVSTFPGVSSLSYAWYLNSSLVGTAQTYVDPSLHAGDNVSVVVTSLLGCINNRLGNDTLVASLTVNHCPTAGPDQTVCAGDTAFITAATGSGTWSVVAGNPSYSQFFNPSLPVTHIELSGAITGIYKYIWTTSSGPDTLTVTVNNCDSAGPNQTICIGDTDIAVSAIGAGTWSVLPGNPATTNFVTYYMANTHIEFGGGGMPATIPGVYRYLWTTSSGADTLTVTINNCATDTVWPGDADANHVVDNNDLLTIGLGYDSTGPLRVAQGIVWQADPATDWSHDFTIYAPLVNFVHADCNGDGTINADDTLAIVTNFGLTHLGKDVPQPWRSGIPGLYPVVSADTVTNGDTLNVAILLGDSSLPVTNIYGLAFTYNYDPLVVYSNSGSFSFISSWLGDNTNSISIHHDDTTTGTVKAAITGINHLGRSGYGTIATMRCIITTDNINGKNMSYYTDHVYITGITAIDAQGNAIPLNEGIDSSEVGFIPNGISEIPDAPHISVYPNPASGQVIISTQSAIAEVSMTDMLGQRVITQNGNNRQTETIDVSQLPAGVYTVYVSTGAGSAAVKLIISR